MKRSSLWTLLVLALAAGLGACDSAQEVTAPQTTPEAVGPEFAFTIGHQTALIGAEGGAINVGDNYLYVPPGAVDGPTTFHMSTSNEGPYGMGVSLTAYAAGGAVEQFNRDMVLSLSFEGLEIKHPHKLVILRDGEPLPTYVDKKEQRLWAATDHFTKFLIADL